MSDIRDPSRVVRFALDIPGEKYLSYYAGAARAVAVTAFDGRSIRFPAGVLQQFVTREGIHGVFEMEFDANHKFLAIRRVP